MLNVREQTRRLPNWCMLTSSRSCKSNAAFRVNVANLYFQELTAAEEEQVEEDKEKQLQVSHKLLFVYTLVFILWCFGV